MFRTVLLCRGLLACAIPASFAQSRSPYIEGEVIVGLADDGKAATSGALLKELGATVHYRFTLVRAEVWRITTMTTAEAVRRYTGDPRVRYIEPNYVAEGMPEWNSERKDVPVTPEAPSLYADYEQQVGLTVSPADRARAEAAMAASSCGSSGLISNDPLSDKQWSLHNVGDASAIGGGSNGYVVHCDADVDGPEALTVFTSTTKSVVAIVDDGGWNHEDYAANLWVNPGEDINGNGMGAVYLNGTWQLDPGDINGLDDDGNGFVDDLIGWDFLQGDKDPQPTAPFFHGVRVAGVAGSVPDNGIGITSLSPFTRLMILRGTGNIGRGLWGARRCPSGERELGARERGTQANYPECGGSKHADRCCRWQFRS